MTMGNFEHRNQESSVEIRLGKATLWFSPLKSGGGAMRQDKLTRDTDQLTQSFTQQNDAEPQEQTAQPLPQQDTAEEIIDVYFVRREAGQEEEEAVESMVQKNPQANLPYASFIVLAVNILLALSVLLVAILPQLTSSVTITLI